MTNPLKKDLEHIMAHTGDLWDEFRGSRIFLTGGTGFFGCWFLESLFWANDELNLGAEVTVLTRCPADFAKKAPHLASHPAIRFHIGDVRSFAFPEGPFSHVIHAATESSIKLNAENPLLVFDTIVQGTRRCLDFSVQARARKFLLTSSGAVYGRQPGEMSHIPETYTGGPDCLDSGSVYAEGKRMAEMLCVLYSKRHPLETKIARSFAFVGPYLPLDAHFAIGNFIRDALLGGPIVIRGNGMPRRSYLYAADLIIWLWTILVRSEPFKVYNVGSDKDVTISDVADKVAQAVGGQVDIVVQGDSRLGSNGDRYVPDTSRARKELSLGEYIGLEEAIGRTIRWAEKNYQH